jgi:hypothetical protein
VIIRLTPRNAPAFKLRATAAPAAWLKLSGLLSVSV